MDTSTIRQWSQIALAAWCAAEGIVLVLSRGHAIQTAGVRWSLLGLICFGVWMFLSALTIRDIAVFPRQQALWAFAALEAGTATSAWAWLWVNIRQSFRFSLRAKNGAT